MSQRGLNTVLSIKPGVDLRRPLQRRSSVTVRQELEGKLATLQRDYAELHAEIFEAAQVHRKLCAPRMVRYGNFEIASEIFAVRHLPGDFFTIKKTSDRTILALGDICGKGLAAGMWTSHMVELVGTRAAIHSEPESIVAGVNRDLCLTGSNAPLASLFVASLDPVSGTLNYCSAGHPPTLLLRATGQLELLSEGGTLVGWMPAARYQKASVKLEAGDTLLAYTDGVFESCNKAEEEFGLSRLESQLRMATGELQGTIGAEAILFSILAAVQDFAAAFPLVDDLSLVVIRRDGD
jgi:sigma-B regulation protein RsbU (phosphoserine phosphatase)